MLHRQEQAHDDGIWCVAWRRSQTPGGLEHIVTGSSDDTAKAWKWTEEPSPADQGDAGSPLALRYIFDGHSLGLVSVDINAEGTVAASSSLDSHIRLWDLDTGAQLQTIDCTPVDSWTVAFSPDSKQIGTGSHFGKVNLYCTERGQLLHSLDTAGKFTLAIAFVGFFVCLLWVDVFAWEPPESPANRDLFPPQSPDGRTIACGSVDGMIKVFDVETGKLTRTLEGHAMPIRSLCFSSDSQYLVTGSDDRHIKLYEVSKFDSIATLSGHGSWVLSVDFAPNSLNFASRCVPGGSRLARLRRLFDV